MSRWICSIIYLYILQRLWLQQPGLGGGAGILWVQVTGIEWGQKWKPKKSLGLPTKSKQMAISKINTQKSYAEFLASHSGIFREQLVFQSCCLVGSQPNTSSPKIACVKDFWISEPLKFQKSMDITRKIKTLEIECFCLLIYHSIWSYLSASGSHFNSTRDSQEHLGFFITNLQIVWNTPQKSPVKSSRPKKYLPHFPSKKKTGNENFKPTTILWTSPSGLKSRVPPWDLRFSFFSGTRYNCLGATVKSFLKQGKALWGRDCFLKEILPPLTCLLFDR